MFLLVDLHVHVNSIFICITASTNTFTLDITMSSSTTMTKLYHPFEIHRLSAFVTKTFHQAKQQIFIDDATIIKAINWMISHQASDGHFPEPGRVIHKDMQVCSEKLPK